MDKGTNKPLFRPLPKGWTYLLSRRDARALSAEFPSHFARLEFTGTCLKPSVGKSPLGDSYCAGEIEARGTEAGWRFRLEVRGIPTAVVGSEQESLRRALLDESRQFCVECLRDGSDPTATPVELRFFMRHKDGVLRPHCSRWKLEGLMENLRRARSPWWE
jgi:hypothetical protein